MIKKTVGDVMTTQVAVVREEDNLLSLLDGMERLRFHHLPVVDGDRVVGMLSQRDLLPLALQRGGESAVDLERYLERTFVAQVMRKEVQTVPPTMSLSEASRLVLDARVGALPVVNDQGKMVGLLTSTDLLRVAHGYFSEAGA